MSHKIVLAVSSIVVLALLAFLGLQAAGVWSQNAVAQAQTTPAASAALPRTITVVGTGKVSVKPDVATISVGVQVDAATVKEATSQAASQMDKILATLKAQGIADKDIQTNNYSINYDARSAVTPVGASKTQSSPAETGVYHVSNMVQVKVRDLAKVSAVVDAVIDAGANNLWGINFTLEDTSKVASEARARAVSDAKARAEEYAKLIGAKVGPALQVSEVIGGGSVVGNYMLDSAARYGAGGGPGAVSAGELDIQMQAQVIYAIE